MNRRKKITVGILILVAISLALILISFGKEKENRVCFKNNCFKVELADNSEERSRGLTFKEKLEEDRGMLFIFDKEGEYPFWMKNTLVALDIIWLNENREVVFISENAQPCEEDFCLDINPAQNAKYVLEINGGISKQIGLKINDEIDLEIK